MSRLSSSARRFYEPAPDYEEHRITDEPSYPPPISPDTEHPPRLGDGARYRGSAQNSYQNPLVAPSRLRRSPQNTETQKTLLNYSADPRGKSAYIGHHGVSGGDRPALARTSPQSTIAPRDIGQRSAHRPSPPATIAMQNATSRYHRSPMTSPNPSHANSTESYEYDIVSDFGISSATHSGTISSNGSTHSRSSNVVRSPHVSPPSTVTGRAAAEQILDTRRANSPRATPSQAFVGREVTERVPQEGGATQHRSPPQTIDERYSKLPQSMIPVEYEYRSDLIPKQQRAPHKDMGQYLRAIGGVPVLPPLTKTSQLGEGMIGAGENLAFRRHVANHRQFDTLNSFKSCEKCPLCKAMNEGEVSLAEAAEINKHSHRKNGGASLITSGKAFGKLEEDALLELEDLDDYITRAAKEEIFETNPSPKQSSAKLELRGQAIHDFKAANDAELSVQRGETLLVVQQRNVWWQCKNSKGNIGWVPVCYIYASPE